MVASRTRLAAGTLVAAGCMAAMFAARGDGAAPCRVVASPTPARHTVCRNMDLRRINLAGRNLRYAEFTGSSMQRANLRGADLRGARLQLANLTRANLARAKAAGARMTAAGLTSANLAGADLTGARMNGAMFLTNANLTGATLVRANLTNAFLRGATVTGADFSGARIRGLGGVNVTGQPSALPRGWRVVQGTFAGPTANMWGASFTDADLSGIDLSGANLIYAYMLGNTTLKDTPMTGAFTDGMTWSWNYAANGGQGGPDGGTVICPNGSPALPGYASGLPGAPPVGC
jgi:uncharacterized protein YjbI with pentapeptide repeats